MGAVPGDHTVPPGPEQGPEATVRAILDQAAARLRAAGIDSAALDARILVGAALGLSREQLLTRARERVGADARAALEPLLARRIGREPVSRILGRREFWSLEFALCPDTLDPRPDSETVVEAALALVPRDRPLAILDLGTGSGCLLLALLSELPAAHGLGIDRSAGALATAAANAGRLGLAGRARFECADWRHGLAGHYDLIVANPPYIPEADIAALEPEVARFEPFAALSGGPDGLDAYRLLAPILPNLLTEHGVAVFEVGAGQAAAVAGLLDSAGLLVMGRRNDLAGIERCVIAGNCR
ncbi:MAG: peptide chain release factor N(5)-glutamine methyltransferase [Rhodospirillaceae bacterium]